ncbi:MAG: PilZ domain-containing protein [Pseudomonadota bacterium]
MTAQYQATEDEKTMRRSFRVREAAFVSATPLSEQQFRDLMQSRTVMGQSAFGNHARLVNLEARFQEQAALMGNAPRPVRECLTIMNEKINLLLQEQPKRQEIIESLTRDPALQCEIGASGIRFDHDQQVSEGDKMFLRIMLPADQHYLETAAVVVRTPNPLNTDPTKPYGVAVEFSGFSEAESELLIKHLFQRESESLRMRRLSLDDIQAND